MAMLILTEDWTLVDRIQYWFESQTAARNVYWANRVNQIEASASQIDLLIVDDTTTLQACDLPKLESLSKEVPAIWICDQIDNDSAPLPIGRGCWIERWDLTQQTLIRARERAIGYFRQHQPSEPTSDMPASKTLSEHLAHWLQPLDEQLEDLSRSLSWITSDTLRSWDHDRHHAAPQIDSKSDELTTIALKTEHLRGELHKLHDICDLLGESFQPRRTRFDLTRLAQETLTESQIIESTIIDRDDLLAGECPVFADARHFKACLLEVVARMSSQLAPADRLQAELRRDAHCDAIQLVIWDPTPVSSEEFAQLNQVWRHSQWSVDARDPDFLSGLGLVREKLRFDGGELGLVREIGRGVGMQLSIPSAQIAGIASGYQSFIRYTCPSLKTISQFEIQLTPQRFEPAALPLVNDFLQTRLGGKTWVVPTGRARWTVLAPILETETDEFIEWAQECWRTHLLALTRLGRQLGIEVDALEITTQNQLDLQQTPGQWVEAIQTENPHVFTAIAEQPLVVLSDFEPDVLQGLAQHLSGTGCRVQVSESQEFQQTQDDSPAIVVDLRSSSTDAYVQLDQLTREGLARNVIMLSSNLRAQADSLAATTQDVVGLRPQPEKTTEAPAASTHRPMSRMSELTAATPE